MNKFINSWEKETQKLAIHFAQTYFNCETEMWWVSKEIGGCLHINDYFFNLSDIVDFLKYKYTQDEMFKYYEYRLEIGLLDSNRIVINIKNWKKLGGKNAR